MLVLSRRLGEELTIGDNIKIQIIALQGHLVRMGIDAPASLNVTRSELFDDESTKSRSPRHRKQRPRSRTLRRRFNGR